MVITEIGGTVGDIESLPFLEAARQVRHEVGRENCFFLHCSLVPYMAPSGELKTKPTQHSVAALRSIGITPDALILRCDRDVPEPLKNKIALMCDVDIDGVISTPDAPSIYDIPKVLHREELDAYVVRRLNLPFRDVDWTQWNDLLQRVHEPQETVRIALVGKYIDLSDAYLSVAEALRAGGFKHRAKVEMRWVASDDCETDSGAAAALERRARCADPRRLRHSRHRGQDRRHPLRPQAAACRCSGCASGLQCIVIEAARSVGLTEANSAEFDPKTPDPVISTMADQRDAVAGEADLGGTMRLGAYPAVLEAGSIVAQAYQATEVSERHRHRYEVNNDYRDRIAESGLRFSGTSPDGHLVEFVEYAADVHPFIVGTQAHPELKSRPTRPHPLFVAFIGAALDYKAEERLPGMEIPEQRANGAEHPDNVQRQTARKNPRPVAEHDFETVVIRNPLRRKDFRTARRRGPHAAAATSRAAKSSSTTARWPSSRSTTTTTSSWSTSTATRSAGGCGSCRPACWTSAVSRRTSPPPANSKEEAGLAATEWRVLVDLVSAPGFQRRERAGLPRHRADRRRPARRPRRGGRPDGAVVSARRGRADGVERRDRQFHCGERDSGRPRRRRATLDTCGPSTPPWVDRPTAFARHGRSRRHDRPFRRPPSTTSCRATSTT